MALSVITKHPAAQKAPKRISILGATGTIGQNTIDLLLQAPDQYQVQVLTARSNGQKLIEQALLLSPAAVVIEDEAHYATVKEALSHTNIAVSTGTAALVEAAQMPTDWLMSGIVGAAALAPTLAAIEQGITVAIANKECLVCAGPLITAAAKKYGTTLLPVDSEHNSIFQCLHGAETKHVDTLTLTASGGPFRRFSRAAMEKVTPKQAVAHPNWSMGDKISVDSATMMNKGLEIIEAYHLFPLKKEQIQVLVHPESIVHCLVTFTDGGTLACLSQPDMRVPIAHTLAWPQRLTSNVPKIDLATIGKLTFEAPDEQRFPALRLAREALAADGAAPIILNAANEIAVAAFLAGRIRFLDIAMLVEKAMEQLALPAPHTVEEIQAVDKLARECVNQEVIGN